MAGANKIKVLEGSFKKEHEAFMNSDDFWDEFSMPRTRNSSRWSLVRQWAKKNKNTVFLGGILIMFALVIIGFVSIPSASTNRVNADNLSIKTDASQAFSSNSSLPWDVLRLPSWLIPYHYNLNVKTNLDSFTFTGNVRVDFQLLKSSDFIVIHASELNLTQVTIAHSGAKVKDWKENSPLQFWIIQLDSFANPGNYSLSLNFDGTLSDSFRGYYWSRRNTDSDDVENQEYIALTQFEATDARRAFPCFDEPALKATFNISMTVSEGLHALSNMPVKGTLDLSDGWKTFVFEKTVRMSTYLIAFVVSDEGCSSCDWHSFEAVKGKTKRGLDVAVWNEAGKSELGRYALDSAITILDYYETTFGILYPLPKCDLIAIPDFRGAMENFGLLTFRKDTLLFDPQSSPKTDKQHVAEIIAHELAHQWFGDLVTMEWWSDLWLNEGFAQYMEYRGASAVDPNFSMSEQFVTSELYRAMSIDQSDSTHSIVNNVTSPQEIFSVFDTITYSKGASILSMLEAWIQNVSGTTSFFNSLNEYLKTHAYSNVETPDLWKSLSSSNVDVGSVMSTWTNQPGFPVVIIDGNTLSQERFYISGSLLGSPESGDVQSLPSKNHQTSQKWSIPLLYSIHKQQGDKLAASEPRTLLVKELGPVQIIDRIQSDEYILANVGRSGFYRVQYPIQTYRFFSDALQKNVNTLPPVDRAGLLADTFALSFSGRLKSVNVVLNLTRFLQSESDTVVWWAAIDDLSSIRASLILSPAYGHFNSYFSKLISKVADDLGWTETSQDASRWHIRALLRSQVFVKAIELQSDKEINFALEKFSMLKKGETLTHLSSDVYDAIYQAAAQWGTEDDFDWLVRKYQSSSFAAEKKRLLVAFASTNQPYLQIKTLNMILSGQIRQQDIVSLIVAVASYSSLGHLYTWNWLRSNWSKLIKTWKGNDFTRLNFALKTVVSRFTQPVLVKEAEDLFLAKKDPSFFVPPRCEESIVKGLEKSKSRIWWVETFGKEIETWLIAEGY